MQWDRFQWGLAPWLFRPVQPVGGFPVEQQGLLCARAVCFLVILFEGDELILRFLSGVSCGQKTLLLYNNNLKLVKAYYYFGAPRRTNRYSPLAVRPSELTTG